MGGLFITFEGGEGAGKSTQIRLLGERLKRAGVTFIPTREPGGTAEAEALRTLLVSGEPGRWTASAEALLNYAARDSHLAKVVRPALAAGTHVICDRFMDSTRAYQGYGGDCPMALIDQLEQAIVGATIPDLTLVFDLDPELGLERARTRGGDDRYERKGLDFHRRLRDGFRSIAKAAPARCRLIDAGRTEPEVAAEVLRNIEGLLKLD